MPQLEQSQLSPMFSVPVMSHIWEDADALNKDLLSAIFAQESSSGGQQKTNVGGWQSTEDLQKWGGPAGQRLLEMIVEIANHATSQLFDAEGVSEELKWGIALWANVNRTGEYNMMHIHAGSTWSGVYYVDVGDPVPDKQKSGNITFVNPNLAAASSFFTNVMSDQSSVNPVNGQMLLFPSYLQHYVQPYWGTRPRVTIAFNIKKEPFP